MQIEVETETGERVMWVRHYYVLPLEVRSPHPNQNLSPCQVNSQAKRFISTRKKNDEIETTELDSPSAVFAGQILAEMFGAVCYPEFFNYLDQEVTLPPPRPLCPLIQAFVILISHGSFQLYHANFPKSYLQTVHDKGDIPLDSSSVTLRTTKPYDFHDPEQRTEWVSTYIALVEYLRSGTSKIGYLNRLHPKNMLFKPGWAETPDQPPRGPDPLLVKLAEQEAELEELRNAELRELRKRLQQANTGSGIDLDEKSTGPPLSEEVATPKPRSEVPEGASASVLHGMAPAVRYMC
jgi:hypothetical protein